MLFVPPAPSPAAGASSEVAAPPRNPFVFEHKPNALDRDKIVIPAGWDSWGKIAVLRDGFDAKLWGEAWENDLDHSDDSDGTAHAQRLYASLVPDMSRKVYSLPCLRISLHSPCLHPSRPLSHHSTTQLRSKCSWPRITTRTRRSPTAILAARSATRTRRPLRVSWVQWAAAVSISQTWNVH